MKINKSRLREIVKEELLGEAGFWRPGEFPGSHRPGETRRRRNLEQTNQFEVKLYRNDSEYGPIQVGSLISDLGSPAMAKPRALEALIQSVRHYQNDPDFDIEIVSGGHILSGENPPDAPM